MSTPSGTREQTVADYFAVVRRYKWVIIVAVLVVPAVAYFMSARESKVYRDTADVLLNRQDLGTTITGLPTQSTVQVQDPDRYGRTQARLAEAPAVLDRARKISGLGNVEGWGSDVSADPETDILTFGVNHGDPDVATALATAYAQAFTEYKLQTDTASITRARRELQGRLAELRRAGATSTGTYQDLLGQEQDLRTLEILLAPATVIRAGDGASQIAPLPRRNAILGVMLGLMLGIGGAFALNAFDRRIRHADEVEHELQIPLLAKLPTPGRGDTQTILERAPDETTEAVARLRASFDFGNQNLGAKTVMITSAGPREGKSTTIANLAIALARTGRHVVLVDLDLRRPMLSRLFHLPDGPGVTDFAARDTELVDVLQPVGVTPLRARVAPIGGSPETGQGRLEVITTGRTRVEPAAFVESSGLTEALHTLRSHAEIVLIDAPPILATGDSMALTGKVDAVLLITRLGTLTRPTLQELGRVLRRSPAPVLGLVATGAEIDEGYSVYAVDEYYAQARPQPEAPATPQARLEEVPDVRSATGGSTRWTPRRGG
jgi:capsular exopolysaccharide synthesis family protein